MEEQGQGLEPPNVILEPYNDWEEKRVVFSNCCRSGWGCDDHISTLVPWASLTVTRDGLTQTTEISQGPGHWQGQNWGVTGSTLGDNPFPASSHIKE